ncbi:MAG TPA: FMN-binding negative transcriptional regulator [Edaphobacter sp.]|nr:FMN-binding negative transcriptional regulator [Edaphobacter sp.]
MYIPKAFEENRLPVLHDLIEAQPFASLITMGSSGLFASHLPMVLDRQAGTNGILRGHLSRANRQWRELSPEIEALAIFSGPQHYITPNWYPEKQDTGKVVPTWNYAVVHAYGNLKIIEDTTWLLQHLQTLTGIHEAASPTPWQVSDAPHDYIESQIKGIIGLEFSIGRLEGKWKVSQNRSERDRIGVSDGLERLDTDESLAMKLLVDRSRS